MWALIFRRSESLPFFLSCLKNRNVQRKFEEKIGIETIQFNLEKKRIGLRTDLEIKKFAIFFGEWNRKLTSAECWTFCGKMTLPNGKLKLRGVTLQEVERAWARAWMPRPNFWLAVHKPNARGSMSLIFKWTRRRVGLGRSWFYLWDKIYAQGKFWQAQAYLSLNFKAWAQRGLIKSSLFYLKALLGRGWTSLDFGCLRLDF